MITLSRRQADASLLLSSLEHDQQVKAALAQQLDDDAMQKLIGYTTETYRCSEADAEEALQHILRGITEQRQGRLTNRVAQQIVIPPTDDNPVGRTVPIAKAAPPTAKPLTVDATPTITDKDKVDDLTKPVVDKAESRQQQVIDAIKAEKTAGALLVKAMFALELSEEEQGKAITKIIEVYSNLAAEHTANTVKTMVSPLIGGS